MRYIIQLPCLYVHFEYTVLMTLNDNFAILDKLMSVTSPLLNQILCRLGIYTLYRLSLISSRFSDRLLSLTRLFHFPSNGRE